MNEYQNVSDKSLVDGLKSQRANEKEALLDILKRIVEIERRGIHLREGYPSMFVYLTTVLDYSENGAARRLRAARCIAQFPESYDLLKEGKLNLCTITEAFKVLTPENKQDVLGKVAGKNAAFAREVVSELRPEKAKKSSIRPVTIKKASASTEPDLFSKRRSENHYQLVVKSEPRFEFKFQADKAFMNQFNEVKRAMSGKFPKGLQSEELFSELMSFYLKEKSKKIAKLRKFILTRDGERCTWEHEGKRCDCNWDLEIDHIKPRALGGSNNPNNLRTLCRAHNALHARNTLGSRAW